jgi:hypothetical protein
MEAVRSSETSVNFNVSTRRYIPQDSKLHTRRRENLKSHKLPASDSRAWSEHVTVFNQDNKPVSVSIRVSPVTVLKVTFTIPAMRFVRSNGLI